MNFEQILNFITEKPKHLLSEYVTPGENDMILHHELKRSTQNLVNIEYTLNRLEKEFKDSLAAAVLIKQS
jgi:hypothetical protein